MEEEANGRWMDLETKAVSLIYHSFPLRNRLIDERMDGCTDEGMKDALKHLKTQWEGSTDAWKEQRQTGKSQELEK